MSIKRNWVELFSTVPEIQPHSLWFKELSIKHPGLSPSAFKNGWDKYKQEYRSGNPQPQKPSGPRPQENFSFQNKADFEPIFNVNKNFLSLEEGEYEIRTPYLIKGERNILVISDIHIPYHVRPVLMLALETCRDVDTIILNGDIVDFYACSFWDKRPDKTLLKREIEMGWNFFDGLRKMFPSAEIIFKSGNHEFRFERYICQKAPAFFGMDSFAIPEILKLKDYGISYVSDKQMIKAGDLTIIHGHEIRMTLGAVNVARTLYLKANANIMFGDRHVSQEYFQRDIHGKVRGAWAVGCLCDLSPDYAPVNNWNHGFARVQLNSDNSFSVDNKKIILGKVL